MTQTATIRRNLLRLTVAVLVSVLWHGALLGLFFALLPAPVDSAARLEQTDVPALMFDPQEVPERHLFLVEGVDPLAVPDGAEIGERLPKEDALFMELDALPPIAGFGKKSEAGPVNLPAPPGLGPVTTLVVDRPGSGPNAPAPGAGPGQGLSLRRTRSELLRNGAGTNASEAAVARGLKWLIRTQSPDGRWLLDGPFPDKGVANDTAGTALALLPFLAGAKTHKPAKDNPYDREIEKGLNFLLRRQDKKTGNLGGGMYGHGLAAIVLCEVYGLTQDLALRRPAQLALNYIVASQHEAGGWRYGPGQPGDMSVTGWQVMALKSGQLAGLDVPTVTLSKAQRFLDALNSTGDEGYGYVERTSAPTTTAIALLCRQFTQGWGPQNLRLIRGIDNHLKPLGPAAKKDSYYYYYATQVMYHFGGEAWQDWNAKMRDALVKSQVVDQESPLYGSWSSVGDAWGSRGGGRLMVTSLNLLTLEVYYRYLPLYQREKAADARR